MLDVCRYWGISPLEYEAHRPELRAAMIDYAVRETRARAAAERRAAAKRKG